MKGGFNLSRWALEHIPLTRYLIAALLIGGILSYTRLGQDEDPPFTFRAMVVRANWPGATALQMADQVTDKLEKKLQETPYIDKIRSYSKPGETLIILQLRESTPPKETAGAWYQVRKKIGDIRGTLPPGIVIRSPVRGLTPCRGPRSATWNFPNPVKFTSPPPRMTLVIVSRTASTASPAAFLLPIRSSLASRSRNSALVTSNPPRSR